MIQNTRNEKIYFFKENEIYPSDFPAYVDFSL